MKKKVKTLIKLNIAAGEARLPSPPPASRSGALRAGGGSGFFVHQKKSI